MGFFEASFEVVEEKNCPMYSRGDWLHLSGLAFLAPKGKPTCLFLARELTDYMLKRLGEEHFAPKRQGRDFFNCSGCTGLIKFKEKRKEDQGYATPHMRMLVLADAKKDTRDIESISTILNSFSLFQIIDEHNLADILTNLTIKEYQSSEYIIRKGDKGAYLYIILNGKVEVISGEQTIACLGRGEIFGEMSLLTGKPVGASIRVIEPTKILMISSEQFRQLVIKYPSIQLGISKILAQRLSVSNLQKGGSNSASFSGKLAELSVAELCQLLHHNDKTGVISLVVGGKEGQLFFFNGEIVKAEYDGVQDRKAFFALLKESEGRFDFTPNLSAEDMKLPAISSFMGMLMAGLQSIDEENASKKPA